jgi:general secretion pathway protein A
MYLPYYGLKKPPFSISPDPNFLWLSPKHARAFSALKYGILEEKGFLALLGEIGTGKTVLIKSLINEIDIPAIIVTIPDPDMDALDFFNFLAEEAQMNKEFSAKGEFLIHFKQFLLNACGSDKKVLLIVDEAQRLNFELLEQIRLLSNIEMTDKKLLNIFFVGQTEFDIMLKDERSKATQQRIAVRSRLEPLDEKETAIYIGHRLKVAGAAREIFNFDAIQEIYKLSNGIPRIINIICDNALMVGYGYDLGTIDKDAISAYKKELEIPEETEPERKDVETEIKEIETTIMEKPKLIQLSQKKSNPNSARPQPKEEADRKAPSYVKNLIILVFFLVFGFTGYYIYDSKTKTPTRWSAQDIAPKKDFGLSQIDPKGIGPKNGDQIENQTDNQLPTVVPRQAVVGNQANEKESSTKSVNQDGTINEELFARTLPEDTDIAESVKEKETEIKSKNAENPPENQPGEQPILAKQSVMDLIEDANPDKKFEKSSENAPLLKDLSILNGKILVYFSYDSLALSQQSMETLRIIVDIISKYPRSNITIEGYADSKGDFLYNEELSQARADVVKTYFNNRGISLSRITAQGMGSQNPIGNNETLEGRQKNRRAEIIIEMEGKGDRIE